MPEKRITLKRILLHISFWVFIQAFFLLKSNVPEEFKRNLSYGIRYLPSNMFFIYAVLYWLMPNYLLKKKYTQFAIWFLLTLCVATIYSRLVMLRFVPGMHITPGMIFSFAVFQTFGALFFIGGFALSIKLFKLWYIETQRVRETEKQKLTAELELLKSQVHPHFLFNTLNNLYSLTLEQSKQSSEVVLKLAGLLRYMLYECNEPEVPLVKEAEIMKNYIELEKMRYGSRLDVSLNISGDIESKLIAPLILLPFLENSFKHGTSNQIDQCWINFDLRVEGDTMKFKLINSRSETEDDAIIGGLGLNNAKKRLELLYPSKYNLKLIPDEETFTVSLVMQLTNTVSDINSATIVTPNNHRYENEMPVSG